MFAYNYKIITPERTIIEGKMSGYSALWVRFKLRRQKNTVLFVQKESKVSAVSNRKAGLVSLSSIQRILFFRNMSMMLDSGICLADALYNNANQARGIGVKRAMTHIYSEVSNGSQLSKALSKYPSLFPLYLTKTIEVGEQSGTLPTTLDRISQDLERSYELRRKVVGAISYPLIIIFFMIVTAILLIVMVLPQIIKLFADLDAPVPTTTLLLQSAGEFLSSYPLQILAGLLATVIMFSFLMRVRGFRLVVHASLLRIPVFGNLMKEYSLSVFTRALSTLLSSGITFVQALDTVKGTLKNESYIQTIEQMYPVVLQGGAFSDAMRISSFHFPDQFRYLVEVGERTGRLQSSFEKASTHYERSVMFQTQMLTTVIEPLLMLIAGLLVGYLAFSIFGPLYGIATYM
jgi:type IV pilus assembly protein PilC